MAIKQLPYPKAIRFLAERLQIEMPTEDVKRGTNIVLRVCSNTLEPLFSSILKMPRKS